MYDERNFDTENGMQENPQKDEPVNAYSDGARAQDGANAGQSASNDAGGAGFAPAQNHAERMQRPKKGFTRVVASALVFGLVAGVAMFGVNAGLIAVTGSKAGQTPAAAATAEPERTPAVQMVKGETASAAAVSTSGTVANVAANTLPAVVAITSKTVQEINSFFFGGQGQLYENEASGSGIIIGETDTELLIATNEHVVSDTKGLSVAFVDNAAAEAQIKGTDAEQDLAVIAVKLSDVSAETLSAIRVVEIGDSDSLAIGEQVVAIGNALGYGQSVTGGYVSALNREITLNGVKKTLIQTDAAINPGNSGGALLNMAGQLIGINEAKASTSYAEAMGYAIPISAAEPILNELMNKETRYKASESEAGMIGISCTSVSEEAVQYYGMPEGAFVAEVTANGPAAAAGIQQGDIITKFDGERVTGSKELSELVTYYTAGTQVNVTIARANNGAYAEQEVSVTLGSKAELTKS